MSKNNKVSKDIECCPYCGGEEYYIKQSYKGNCKYHRRFDGTRGYKDYNENCKYHISIDSTEAINNGYLNGYMDEWATYKKTSKYAWCSDCGKRLFELEKDY